MKLSKTRITFLGAGNMAEALISGILSSKLLPANQIYACDIDSDRLTYLKGKYGVESASSAKEAVQQAQIIFLAVKPQNLEELLNEIGTELDSEKLIISIAAGVRVSKLEKFAGRELRVVRVMPNLPALIQAGVSALFLGKQAERKDMDVALTLLQAVGEVVEVGKEEDLDAVTALSGSGPGYLFYFAEALHQAGVDSGLSEEIVEKLVTATLLGSSKLLSESKDSAATLRQKVTSKGGTTEAALNEMERQKFVPLIQKSIAAAVKRSEELSQ